MRYHKVLLIDVCRDFVSNIFRDIDFVNLYENGFWKTKITKKRTNVSPGKSDLPLRYYIVVILKFTANVPYRLTPSMARLSYEYT